MKNIALSGNKTVFISGAAGGLGKVLVKEYTGQGFKVIAADIDISGLSGFAGSENVVSVKLDVTDTEQLEHLPKDFGLDQTGLDMLVCLAGIYDTYPVTEADPSFFKKIIDVNLHGVASLVRCFLKPLIRNKGRVIVVSSESYKIQALFQPYMVSKAALESYCRAARQELALKGVRMVVIRPGAIRTPLLRWMESTGDHEGKYPVFKEEMRKSRHLSLRMVGKISNPEEVSSKILLASIARRPKRIYRVKNNMLLSIMALLPAAILDRIIVRKFRMKK